MDGWKKNNLKSCYNYYYIKIIWNIIFFWEEHFILFIFIFFSFLYSYVHTLIGPFLPSATHLLASTLKPSCFQAEAVLSSSPILLKRRHKQEERQTSFASWDKDSYTERFLALLPYTNVLQRKLIHLYLTFSLVPDHLPILTSVTLRFLC
jgi:hypothetical protein